MLSSVLSIHITFCYHGRLNKHKTVEIKRGLAVLVHTSGPGNAESVPSGHQADSPFL